MNAESEIGIIVREQATAWNAGDGAAYARHFARHGSFTNILGATLYGHAAFAARHVEILASFFSGTTFHERIRRIRLVTPDVAIVDLDVEVRGVVRAPPGVSLLPDGTLHTRLLQVFVRNETGDWQIEAHHNVDVKTRPPEEYGE